MRLSEAKSLRYGQIVYIVGAYDSNGHASRARVNGRVQTWKTRPNEVKVPLKRGLYDTGYLTERNLDKFTLTEPAPKKPNKILRRR